MYVIYIMVGQLES